MLSAAIPAVADTVPKPIGGVDSRVREVVAKDGQVIRLGGRIGYQTLIRFGRGEHVEDVTVGDSGAWAAAIAAGGRALAIKPAGEKFRTNMSVITNRTVYHLELIEGGPAIYEIRLVPPGQKTSKAAQAPTPAPRPANRRYTWSGATGLKPLEAWDNGRHTYLRFAPAQPVPAVYATAPDGSEVSANWHQTSEPGLIAIQQLSSRFVLRSGQAVGCAWNEALAGTERARPSRAVQRASE
jgi:type IV secretion system protein VirB9